MIKKTLLVALSIGLSSAMFAELGDKRPDFRPAPDRLDRLKRVYEDLPADVQEQVDSYREERKGLRDTLKEDYLLPLGEEATADQKKEAIEQFKADYAEQIEANRELAKETFETVRENLPDRPELPEEIRAMISDHKAAKSELKKALREYLATLPEGSTREEVKAAIETFNEDNAEAIAANKELGQEIRELVSAYKDENQELNAEVVERDVLSPELEGARDRFQHKRRELLNRAKRERAELRDLDPEEREAAMLALREDLRDDLKDLKNKRRDFIKERRDEEIGDRRPDE